MGSGREAGAAAALFLSRHSLALLDRGEVAVGRVEELGVDRRPAAQLADPARRLLGRGSGLGPRAGGPSAQHTPLVFVQDLVAGSVRIFPTPQLSRQRLDGSAIAMFSSPA